MRGTRDEAGHGMAGGVAVVDLRRPGQGYAGEFDYYAMALSWSPEHCAIKPGIGSSAPASWEFVLHGLWPQYQRGYPPAAPASGWMRIWSNSLPGSTPAASSIAMNGRSTAPVPAEPGGISPIGQRSAPEGEDPAAYQSPEEPLRKTSFQLKADLASANPWLAPDNITVACADGAVSCGRSHLHQQAGNGCRPLLRRDAEAGAPLLWPTGLPAAQRALTLRSALRGPDVAMNLKEPDG